MFPRWVFHYFPPPPKQFSLNTQRFLLDTRNCHLNSDSRGGGHISQHVPHTRKKKLEVMRSWYLRQTTNNPTTFFKLLHTSNRQAALSGLGQLPIVGVREHVALRWAESCSRFKGDNGDGLLTDGCCGEKSGSQRQTLSYVRFFFL